MPRNGERPGSRSGTSSRLRMRKTNRPEARKLIASISIAIGALSAWMSTPASAGPASCAPEREISSFELPSTSWSRSTSAGKYDWYATSKNTVSTPKRKPTT